MSNTMTLLALTISISCLSTLFGLTITVRLTNGWFHFFREYSNIIKKQLCLIILSNIVYPLTVTLYFCIGSIDVLISITSTNTPIPRTAHYFSITSFIIWLSVLSSFFVFRIIRLFQSHREKIFNQHTMKRYIIASIVLLILLNLLFVSFYLISPAVYWLKLTFLVLAMLDYIMLFIVCQKASIFIWLSRDPLRCIYVEKEPLYTSLLSQMQCKKLVFRFINIYNHSLSTQIPAVIKQLCFQYTFCNDRESMHTHWQLLHGRKLKKEKVKDLKSISKLLFIEVLTGSGMCICCFLFLCKHALIFNADAFYVCLMQICLDLALILTLSIFGMMPSFNSVFYDKLCCLRGLVEAQVLRYLESKQESAQKRTHGSNQMNDSYHISRVIGTPQIHKYSMNNELADDTVITEMEGGGLSTIITELRLESKRKESTLHDSHSLKVK